MPKSNSIRILIADDHEVVRIGLGAVLNLTPGLKVVGHAARMEEAKTLCLRLKPDLVLLDIRLPDGSGIDAARDILSACPDTRILFLTSYADDRTVLEAILSGAQGYMLKDIASDELIWAIQSVAAGAILMDPRLMNHTLHWLKDLSTDRRQARRAMFSPQEQRILPLVAQGLTNKEIAGQLQLSEKTVKNYLANIYSKLQVGRRSQVAAFYAGSFKAASPLPPSQGESR